MRVVKLGDVCDVITRGISPIYTEDKQLGVAVLNQKCIRDKTIAYEFGRLHNLSEKSVNDSKFLKSGDVLVNSTGHGTLGRTALVENVDQPALVDSHITILRPANGMFVPRYFAYLIGRCEKDFVEMATGTSGQTELPRALVSEYQISYDPSLEEQQWVVERLDAAFEKIDWAIELIEKNIKNADAMFGSLLDTAVQRNPDVEDRTIGEIANIEYGLTEKSKSKGDYRLIRITDINSEGFLGSDNKVYVSANQNSEKYLLREGDIVVARTGATFGKVLHFDDSEDAVFASYLIRINFNGEVLPKLFWYFAKTPQYWGQANTLASGAAQPQFNGGALKQIKFSYPASRDEQQMIVERLDAYHRLTLKLKTMYQKKTDDLSTLKQALLTQAFSQSEVE